MCCTIIREYWEHLFARIFTDGQFQDLFLTKSPDAEGFVVMCSNLMKENFSKCLIDYESVKEL